MFFGILTSILTVTSVASLLIVPSGMVTAPPFRFTTGVWSISENSTLLKHFLWRMRMICNGMEAIME